MRPIKFSRHTPTEFVAATIIARRPLGITRELAAAYVPLINEELKRCGLLTPGLRGGDAYEQVRSRFPASMQIVLSSALFGFVAPELVGDVYTEGE